MGKLSKVSGKAYLLCYDISSNRKRSKIHKAVTKSGWIRVQKSVYFVSFISEKAQKKLFDKVKSIMSEKNDLFDSFIIIPVRQKRIQKAIQLGCHFPFEQLFGVHKLVVI